MKGTHATRKRIRRVHPLRQSVYEDMACPALYVAKHVSCVPEAASSAADRGTEVHEIIAIYLNHLVKSGRRKDPEFFAGLLRFAKREVQEALEKFDERYEFDPRNIAGTEMEIALDENFAPLEPIGKGRGDTPRYGKRIAYGARLDAVLLDAPNYAVIPDWKSYFKIIEAPDSFQSKFYPLLLMCWNPTLERVRFVLEFIRYGASRSVEYTRADLPWLKDMATAARRRQQQLNRLAASQARQIIAAPGRHCTWCPLLAKGCPLENANPYGFRTPQEQLQYVLRLRELQKQSTQVLKDLASEHGRLECHDANGTVYVAEFSVASETVYPLADAVPILNAWVTNHGGDPSLTGPLNLSALLKAKCRAPLAQSLARVAQEKVKTRFHIRRLKDDGAENESEEE